MPGEQRVKAMRGFFGIFKDQRGATAVEYGLILALIFLAMIGALTSVTSETIEMWNYVSESVIGA